MRFFSKGRSHYGRPVLPVAVAARTTGGSSAAVQTKGFNTLGLTLDVLSVSGVSPSVTVTIQHSEDGATWRDHTAFPAVTAAGSRRLVVSGLDEFWRLSWTIAETVEFGVSGSVR